MPARLPILPYGIEMQNEKWKNEKYFIGNSLVTGLCLAYFVVKGGQLSGLLAMQRLGICCNVAPGSEYEWSGCKRGKINEIWKLIATKEFLAFFSFYFYFNFN